MQESLVAMTDHAYLALELVLRERRSSISPSVQGCEASGSASVSVLVDVVASLGPRAGLDAVDREEAKSRVRRARFLSGEDGGGVGGAQ